MRQTPVALEAFAAICPNWLHPLSDWLQDATSSPTWSGRRERRRISLPGENAKENQSLTSSNNKEESIFSQYRSYQIIFLKNDSSVEIEKGNNKDTSVDFLDLDLCLIRRMISLKSRSCWFLILLQSAACQTHKPTVLHLKLHKLNKHISKRNQWLWPVVWVYLIGLHLEGIFAVQSDGDRMTPPRHPSRST